MSDRFSLRLAVFFICAMILAISSPPARAQVFKDPLLECNYHEKIDLTWIQEFVNRMLESSGQDKEAKDEMKEKLDILMTLGLFDMKDVTFDCKLQGDQFTGKAILTTNPVSPKGSMLRDCLSISRRESWVRALIPEDKTLAWLSVTAPDEMFNLVEKYMGTLMECCECEEKPDEQEKACPLTSGPVGDLLNSLRAAMGNEAHIVLYDFNLGGVLVPNPKPYFAVIFDMRDDVQQKDLQAIKDSFQKVLVDTYKGEMEVTTWNSYEVRSFKNFGCPLDINPAIIVDKNYFIFATYPETLEETAGYVLTPVRTAQSKLPEVMNGMMTINFNKLMKIIPFDSMTWMMTIHFNKLMKIIPFDCMTWMIPSEGEGLKSLANQIKEENWGSFQMKRTHTDKSMICEFTMDRSMFSFLCQFGKEVMIMGFQESMKYKMKREKGKDKVKSEMKGEEKDKVESGVNGEDEDEESEGEEND